MLATRRPTPLRPGDSVRPLYLAEAVSGCPCTLFLPPQLPPPRRSPPLQPSSHPSATFILTACVISRRWPLLHAFRRLSAQIVPAVLNLNPTRHSPTLEILSRRCNSWRVCRCQILSRYLPLPRQYQLGCPIGTMITLRTLRRNPQYPPPLQSSLLNLNLLMRCRKRKTTVP